MTWERKRDKNSEKKQTQGKYYFILIIDSSTEYLYALTPNLSILNSGPDFPRWQLQY